MRSWRGARAAGIRLRGALGALLCAIVVASSALAYGAGLSLAAPITPSDSAPEVGFTLHTLYLSAHKTFDLATFEANVDELAAQRMQWIRVDLWSDLVAPTGTAQAIDWDAEHLAIYDHALSYAKGRGLRVYLDTFVPSYANGYSEADYLAVARMFYRAIAARYHQRVDIWQIANEPNWSDFRAPAKLLRQPYRMSYVQAFDRLLALARGEIKAAAPSSPIAINLALPNYTPMNVLPFLSVTAPHLDIIGVDTYPGTRRDKLDRTVGEMKRLEATFDKPLMVVETGMCSATDGADGQSAYVPLYLSHLATAHPLAVLLYLYQDTPKASSVSACEKTFGIKDVMGKPKPSYDAVLSSLRALARPPSP